MLETAPRNEYLSTVGEMNPLKVLDPIGTEPVVLCVVAVWTRHTMTGHLEEKGTWIHSFWNSVLTTLPETNGCRLGWNSLFFVVPRLSMAQAVQRIGELLVSNQDTCLESLCVLCEAEGEPEHKLDVMDVMGHEVASFGNFGSSREYQPDGHRFYHLRDGRPYPTK